MIGPSFLNEIDLLNLPLSCEVDDANPFIIPTEDTSMMQAMPMPMPSLGNVESLHSSVR